MRSSGNRLPPPFAASAGAAARAEGLGSLAEAIDRILFKGVTVDGAVTIGVAGVDLIMLDLRLLLAAVDTVKPEGPFFSAPRGDSASAPPAAPAPPAVGRPSRRNVTPGERGASNDAAPAASGPVDAASASPRRGSAQQGLIKLVLTLVNLLHEVLERQAVRRMEHGALSLREIDDLGLALQAQASEIVRLRALFGLSRADLDLGLSVSG